MARPTKNPNGEKASEVISWKLTREIKETVIALANFRNRNIPDLLTTLVLEAAEKDRAGVEAMKALENEAAMLEKRIAAARAALRQNPNASIKLTDNIPTSTTSAETNDDTGNTSSANDAKGKKKA